MDPRSSHPAALAPGAAAHRTDAPGVSDHVVTPGTREELLRGKRIHVAPSNPEHADPHFNLDVALGVHVAPSYVGSTDLLTRVAHDGDFASDTCIRRAGIDPATGQRYLEEMAFEVVNTQRLSDVTAKAEDLSARGVRRVFAVFVRRGVVSEWRGDQWEPLADDSVIEDACLAAPLPVVALLRASELGGATVRALLTRNEPELLRLLSEREQRGELRGEQRGELRGRRVALRTLLTARGLVPDDALSARIDACDDVATLDAWMLRAATATSAAEALAPIG
jgi:hypothetical protein